MTTTSIPTAEGFEPLDPVPPPRRRWLATTVAFVLLGLVGLVGLLSWSSLRVTPDIVRAQQVLTHYVAAWNAGDVAGVAALTCAAGRAAEPVGSMAVIHLAQFDDSRAVATVHLAVYGLAVPMTVDLRSSGWAGWCFDGIR